jgi:Uma2 family endonuclease
VVEVTSDSTEDYDRGEKLSHHKQCQSLRAAVFVSHRRPQLTLLRRTPEGFEQREYFAGERLELDEPRLELSVDAVYAGVALDSA